jgi:hypothetical protein
MLFWKNVDKGGRSCICSIFHQQKALKQISLDPCHPNLLNLCVSINMPMPICLPYHIHVLCTPLISPFDLPPYPRGALQEGKKKRKEKLPFSIKLSYIVLNANAKSAPWFYARHLLLNNGGMRMLVEYKALPCNDKTGRDR